MTEKPREHRCRDDQIWDGDIIWATSHVQLVCCDCAKTHTVLLHKRKGKKLVPNDQPIALKVLVDDSITEVLRYEKGIKIKRKKR